MKMNLLAFYIKGNWCIYETVLFIKRTLVEKWSFVTADLVENLQPHCNSSTIV